MPINALQSLPYFVPEMILVLGGLLVVILDLFVKNKKTLGWLTIGILLFSLLPLNPGLEPRELFSGMSVYDQFGIFFKYLTGLVLALIVLMSLDYAPLNKGYAGEYYALLLFLGFGMMLMAGASNLIMVQLSIETVSLISYILVAFNKKDARSSEAALKYFLFGSVASAVMLFGMTYLFGMTGSLNFSDIFAFFRDGTADSVVFVVAMLLIMVGFGFKIAMVPFHWWVPDTYEGAPTPITAFLSVGSKAVGFAIFYRVFMMVFPTFYMDWAALLGVLAIITMTTGNVVAVLQDNVKRMLAYSSVAHAGYILVGLAISFTDLAREAILVYLATYFVMNVGAFIILMMVGSDELDDYSGLSKRSPGLAFAFAGLLLSLTGIPPLAGFFGKYYIFMAAVDAGVENPFNYWLAVAVAINSAIAAYYYFRVIRQMYMVEPVSDKAVPASPMTLKMALAITLILTVTLFIYISPILSYIRHFGFMLQWN